MTHSEGSVELTTQQVFDFLRGHAGAVFLLEDLCRQTGCSPTHARLAVDTLVQTGLIHRERTVGGQDAYGYRLRDPLISR